MTKVVRSFETENGTFLNTIAYNAVVKTPLGSQVRRDWYSIETTDDMMDQELPDFDPKQWVIREQVSTKVDEATGEETVYTNKWLDEYIG